MKTGRLKLNDCFMAPGPALIDSTIPKPGAIRLRACGNTDTLMVRRAPTVTSLRLSMRRTLSLLGIVASGTRGPLCLRGQGDDSKQLAVVSLAPEMRSG